MYSVYIVFVVYDMDKHMPVSSKYIFKTVLTGFSHSVNCVVTGLNLLDAKQCLNLDEFSGGWIINLCGLFL